MPKTARRAAAAAVLALAVGSGVAACGERQPVAAPAAGPVVMDIGDATSVPPPPAAEREPVTQSAPVEAAITFPRTGSGQWMFTPGNDEVAGKAGRLMRYRIAIETDIDGVGPAGFAKDIRTILGDPRGWTAGGQWRLQQVGPADMADFTIYLATPASRDKLCGGTPDSYTSCRNGSNVVLNVARWANAVPGYGAPLEAYRQYMVTHETGHRLGQGHELCPGPGRPAPVMEQQTLGLHGCVPNPWPFPDGGGREYAGPPGEYDDPIPAGDS
ncbi:DUF3152 domain-containing protein [Amycolatopsis sp. NPDC058278]|jgi:hypothetical protein|uniref:DUF3152 domain-containing protein n=1 Tax=unclassified Amycolatopsis TaxID=2618356 RepID=UPI00255C09E9|nr:DUF3152 domain-containing protein [Amycolatopsis sp. DG1A-15b]WIX87821.1 DUF3152 domain-containing protein [Amycolatopsis sp. DG1A-15b]